MRISPRPLFAYVGSYTTPERHGQGNGINVYKVDRRTGAFTHVQRLGGLGEPVVPRPQRGGHAPLFGAW
jgi:6-phosphogluconolactonase (cycloisomerase 2 family)